MKGKLESKTKRGGTRKMISENGLLEWTDISKTGPGLPNIGNTCFLNSCIKLLVGSHLFAAFPLMSLEAEVQKDAEELLHKLEAQPIARQGQIIADFLASPKTQRRSAKLEYWIFKDGASSSSSPESVVDAAIQIQWIKIVNQIRGGASVGRGPAQMYGDISILHQLAAKDKTLKSFFAGGFFQKDSVELIQALMDKFQLSAQWKEREYQLTFKNNFTVGECKAWQKQAKLKPGHQPLYRLGIQAVSGSLFLTVTCPPALTSSTPSLQTLVSEYFQPESLEGASGGGLVGLAGLSTESGRAARTPPLFFHKQVVWSKGPPILLINIKRELVTPSIIHRNATAIDIPQFLFLPIFKVEQKHDGRWKDVEPPSPRYPGLMILGGELPSRAYSQFPERDSKAALDTVVVTASQDLVTTVPQTEKALFNKLFSSIPDKSCLYELEACIFHSSSMPTAFGHYYASVHNRQNEMWIHNDSQPPYLSKMTRHSHEIVLCAYRKVCKPTQKSAGR